MAAKSPAEHARRKIWFWLLVTGLLILSVALVFSPGVDKLVAAAADWAIGIMHAYPIGGALVFFLFSALSAMLTFASSVVLVPPASLVWGKPLTFLLLWGGWMAGAIGAFGIGRVAGPLLARLGYQDKLEKYQQFVSQRMKFWAVLLFCFAIPSEVPGYLFGSMRYPFPKFVLAIGIAESAYAAGVVVAGESLLADRPMPLLIALGVLIFVALAAGVLLRWLRKRRAGPRARA